ncbi:MAG: hypothetical protein IJD10_02455 [Clostridia bacterium]|nr:hypothetical protein [Clostridia bacterium]
MKREFLEKLGLGKEAIGAVMAEHGKGIEELRLRCEALEKEASERLALAEENEGLKTALAEQTAAFEGFRDKVIAAAVAEAMPSSGMAKEALIGRLKEAALKGGDLAETVRRLKESDPDAFLRGETVFPVFSAVSMSSVEEFPPLSSALKRR